MEALERALTEAKNHCRNYVIGRWVSDDRGDWLILRRSEVVAEAEPAVGVTSPLVGR